MPRLELVFNCLNMFVADTEHNVVHVLLPSSTGHGGHHRHEPRLFHDGMVGHEKGNGRSLKGWALVLGKQKDSDQGTADITFQPPFPPPLGDELVNISEITGSRVPRELVQDTAHPLVTARISLYGGRVTSMVAEEKYSIRGKPYMLAHQVTWQMLNVPEELEWLNLNADAPPPIMSLVDLPTDSKLGYRLEIHHVMHTSLPRGQGGKLSPAEMGEHYGMFYPLLGVRPGRDDLPRLIDSERTQGVHCGGTRALLA